MPSAGNRQAGVQSHKGSKAQSFWISYFFKKQNSLPLWHFVSLPLYIFLNNSQFFVTKQTLSRCVVSIRIKTILLIL